MKYTEVFLMKTIYYSLFLFSFSGVLFFWDKEFFVQTIEGHSAEKTSIVLSIMPHLQSSIVIIVICLAKTDFNGMRNNLYET